MTVTLTATKPTLRFGWVWLGLAVETTGNGVTRVRGLGHRAVVLGRFVTNRLRSQPIPRLSTSISTHLSKTASAHSPDMTVG